MRNRVLLAGGMVLLLATTPGCTFFEKLGIAVHGRKKKERVDFATRVVDTRLVKSMEASGKTKRTFLADRAQPEWVKSGNDASRLSPFSYRIIRENRSAPSTPVYQAPRPKKAPIVQAQQGSQPTKKKTYKIKRGDTLQKISKRFYGTTKNWKKIYNENRGSIKKPNKIFVGQVIHLP